MQIRNTFALSISRLLFRNIVSVMLPGCNMHHLPIRQIAIIKKPPSLKILESYIFIHSLFTDIAFVIQNGI